MFEQIFFQGWTPLLRTAIGTTVTYVVLIVMLRIAGQRSLAKWYAFDLIVTVALGSTFANAVLSQNITVVQAVLGFLILLSLQFAVSFSVLHWPRLKNVVNAPPTLVLLRGEYQRESMRSQRVSEGDIKAALRQDGRSALDQVDAVILEADGTFSVIEKLSQRPTAVDDVPELESSSSEHPVRRVAAE